MLKRLRSQVGVSLVSSSLLLPTLIVLSAIVVDLARTAFIYFRAQLIATNVAVYASSHNPPGGNPKNSWDQYNLIGGLPGENSDRLALRRTYWSQLLAAQGRAALTAHELRFLNLGYGELKSYFQNSVAFPVSDYITTEQLGDWPNCSIGFDPVRRPGAAGVLTLSQDRVIEVHCRLRTVVGQLLGLVAPGFAREINIRRHALAPRSGNYADTMIEAPGLAPSLSNEDTNCSGLAEYCATCCVAPNPVIEG